MSRIKNEELQEFLEKKRECFSIKATTYLHGEVKNNFLNDCIKREFNESKMAAHVIDAYYRIIKEVPYLAEKEMPEIKNILISKFRL